MILVDVYVPILDREYDFELDENRPVGELVGEIATLVTKQEQIEAKHKEEMFLYAVEPGRLLNPSFTLSQQGIGTGNGLILL